MPAQPVVSERPDRSLNGLLLRESRPVLSVVRLLAGRSSKDDGGEELMAAPVLKTYFKKFKSDQLGQIQLTGILDIKPYATVNLEIINFPNPLPNLTVAVHMGKISGSTLAQGIDHFSLSGPTLIHTYPVIGPDLAVWIVGVPPATSIDVQAWVFLH